ncbi:vesicle-fusing ATPase [Exophiala viscosa]|uniref:Vesicle-fusing ATPase n=1 Tax=Exophiala viscosa TaxID=2486360 RepID=A0AAN6IJ09_9EURO|nr:vesicle-fusing ATPase [Exophiala viscosa]KAI1628116.1 vesicle-fusing ATPase [Exophiala viscosa]
MSAFVVRPSNTDRDAFRIKLTAVSMLSLKLRSGDTCEIRRVEPDDLQHGRKLAIAWEASGAGMSDKVAQTSKLLQEVYGFRLGDKIIISRSSQSLQNAERIFLSNCGNPIGQNDVQFWQQYAEKAIPTTNECLVHSQKLQLKIGDETAELVVKDVGIANAMIARVTRNTKIRIASGDHEAAQATKIDFQPKHLGGLDKQVLQIRKIVGRVCQPAVKQHLKSYQPKQGVLLYGAKGTGKTAFITALAESGWPNVIDWKPGTQIRTSPEPQLIIIRPAYLSRNSGGTANSANEVQSLFEQIRNTPTLVVGEAQHPNDIDQSLRVRGKFSAEIELPIPSAQQRKEILLAIRGYDQCLNDDLLQQMADRTHGYVGDDLYSLLCETVELSYEGTMSTSSAPAVAQDTTDETMPIVRATDADLNAALQQIRPSALQEIFLETPNVRWSDIGGQHEIKRQLHNAVDRPLKHADRMAKLSLKPKKGVLLYGPPGCSKTLLVRALATEAGLNFLAVKGAELISMYVGESERATREVFRKARAASPSIIFFDEIDAIASTRGGSDSSSNLNVLTTLLNEMDGFEELRGVFVVAATNKPQNIDPALMRPGRFDNVVYIGPPDFEARKEIFRNRLSKVQYVHSEDLDEGAGASGRLDLDTEEFAKATKGFSGAEVVASLETAMEGAFDDDRDYVVADDVRQAIGRTPKRITHEILEEFEAWNAELMR